MTNPNLQDALANAVEKEEPAAGAEVALNNDELNVISGGVMMDMDSAEPGCKGMACGLF